MAQFIKSNGTEVELLPESGKHFTLKEMQDCVGGFIEIVYTQDGRLIVLDEEGKLKGKEVNLKATKLYGNTNDCIVGDVLVCTNKEVK